MKARLGKINIFRIRASVDVRLICLFFLPKKMDLFAGKKKKK